MTTAPQKPATRAAKGPARKPAAIAKIVAAAVAPVAKTEIPAPAPKSVAPAPAAKSVASAPTAKTAAPAPAAKPVTTVPAAETVAPAPSVKPVAAAPAPKAAEPAPTVKPVTVPPPAKAAAPAPAAKPVEPKPVAKPVAAAPAAKAAPPAPVVETVAVAKIPAAPIAGVASPATSPAPAAAPIETVEPVAAAPAVPAEPKAVSKPSQPLTSMVSHMTATPTFKGYEEIAAFGKANIDALIQANTVFTKGVEAISKEFISLTQSHFESTAAAAKAMFAAKTLKDVVELNAEFTKAHFDKLVANSTKLGELGTKVATDAFAPISARVTSVVEKAAKPSA
jgi:phasin family protein